MSGKLTLVLGLAGSGKSHYFENHLSGYNRLFDGNYAELLGLLRSGKYCVLTELKYMNPANRDPFVESVQHAVPRVTIEYVCFENNLEIANSNCRVRSNKPNDPLGTAHIQNNTIASQVYRYPKGVTPIKIHVLPPPRQPEPVKTPVEADALALQGRLRLNDENMHQFGQFMAKNAAVFERYFGVRLFEGSLNVYVAEPPSLSADLDARRPMPSVIIPKAEMVGNVRGDGHGWACTLRGPKLPRDTACWIFRRVGSTVSRGIIELLAVEELVRPNQLDDKDPVTILIHRPQPTR